MLVTIMLQVGDCQRAAPSTPATAAAVLLVALLLLTQMSTAGCCASALGSCHDAAHCCAPAAAMLPSLTLLKCLLLSARLYDLYIVFDHGVHSEHTLVHAAAYHCQALLPASMFT